jgi:hypothetical protein
VQRSICGGICVAGGGFGKPRTPATTPFINPQIPFAVSKVLDHGTGNPIVARLTLQIFQIISQCNIETAASEEIMGLYMNSLVKKLLRCWEIRERYRLEFKKQIESYVPPSPQTRAVNIPSVMRLEEDCHNFLYEAKNFARDLLKVFNALYGTQFET